MAETKYEVSSAAFNAIKIDLATIDPPIKPNSYEVESKGFFTTSYEITTNNEAVKRIIQQHEHKLLAGKPYERGSSTVAAAKSKGTLFDMNMDVISVADLRKDLKSAGYFEGEGNDFTFLIEGGKKVSPFIHDTDSEQGQVVGIQVMNKNLENLLKKSGNSTRFFLQTAQLEPQKPKKKARA